MRKIYLFLIFILTNVCSYGQDLTPPIYSNSIRSDYGPRDYSGGTWFHQGIDYWTTYDVGEPFIAVENGEIQAIQYNGWKKIIVNSSTDRVWYYTHIFYRDDPRINTPVNNGRFRLGIVEIEVNNVPTIFPYIIRYTDDTQTTIEKVFVASDFPEGNTIEGETPVSTVNVGEVICQTGNSPGGFCNHLDLRLNGDGSGYADNDNPFLYVQRNNESAYAIDEFKIVTDSREYENGSTINLNELISARIKIKVSTQTGLDLNRVRVFLDNNTDMNIFCYGGRTGEAQSGFPLRSVNGSETGVQPVAGDPGHDIFWVKQDLSTLSTGDHQISFIATNVRDRDVISRTFAFKVAGDGPPRVTSTSPVSGWTSVEPNGQIIIRFNTPMDNQSVIDAFSISPAVTGGHLEVSEDGKLAIFYHDAQPFDWCQQYTVTIADAATSRSFEMLDGDYDGLPGGTFSMFFTVKKPKFVFEINPDWQSVQYGQTGEHEIRVRGENAISVNAHLNACGTGDPGWSVGGLPIDDEYDRHNDWKYWNYSVTNNYAVGSYDVTANLVSHCSNYTVTAHDFIEGPEHGYDHVIHPDDTYEVPSLLYPTTAWHDKHSTIGVLLNGWGDGAAHVLGKYKIAVCGVKKDLTIAGAPDRSLNDLKTLIIPSAGFRGLAGSAIFKERLKYFVNNGGTIVCFTQPRGSDWQALPSPGPDSSGQAGGGTEGGVDGYGWIEDESCFTNAVGMSNYHQVLSSQKTTNTTCNVDGYFTRWPNSSKILLTRVKNSMPSMLMWRCGRGRVIASALYSDWSYGHSGAVDSELGIIRDAVTWAAQPADSLPEYRPGSAVNLTLRIQNEIESLLPVNSVRVKIQTPNRTTVSVQNISLTAPLLPGDSAFVNYAGTAMDSLGIWQIGCDLLDSAGGLVQVVNPAAYFVVSKPPQLFAPGGLSFSVQSESETYPFNGYGMFTINVWNREHQDRTLTCVYYLPIHQIYNSVFEGTPVGSQTITVPADSFISFTYRPRVCHWDNFTVGFDDENGNRIGSASRAFRVVQMQAQMTLTPAQPSFAKGQRAVIYLEQQSIENLINPVTDAIQIYDPANRCIAAFDISVPYLPGTNYRDSVSFVIQDSASFGRYLAYGEAHYNGGVIGSTATAFNVPKVGFSVSPQTPSELAAGSNILTFEVTSLNNFAVAGKRLHAGMAEPGGGEIWQGDSLLSFDSLETKIVGLTALIPALKWGDYQLSYQMEADDTAKGAANLHCQVSAIFRFDKSWYKVRDSLKGEIAVFNTGIFNLSGVNYLLEDEADQAIGAGVFDCVVSDTIKLPFACYLPDNYASGSRLVKLSLTQTSGSNVNFIGSYYIPGSNLMLWLKDTTGTVGDTICVWTRNTGGVDTRYDADVVLYNSQGDTVACGHFNDSLLAGDSTSLGLYVPAQWPGGRYSLQATAINVSTGKTANLYRIVALNGLQARLTAITDKQAYLAVDDITALTELKNCGPALDDVNLRIEAFRAGGMRQKTWQATDWQELNNVEVTPEGIKLFDTVDVRFIKKWDLTQIFATSGVVFAGPAGIASDSKGYIYVSDRHRVQKFDSLGNFILMWGSNGTGDGQFNYPQGITVDGNGFVYVVDCSNHRVQKFDSLGNFILMWGSNGTGDGQFNYPLGISLDGNGFVYVVDRLNHRIQKFDSLGNFLSKFGIYGTNNGQFKYPNYISFDNNGNIYVTDGLNNRVQKFDSQGNYITKWGGFGHGDGQFYYPWGISLDREGYVYIVDQYNSRIQKFDSIGNFIKKWCDWSTGRFNYPLGITIDNNGYIYVSDYSNSRIEKFDKQENFILQWGQGNVNAFPSCIGVDTLYGNVYVGIHGDQIARIDSSGNLINKWGSSGLGDGQFDTPRGIATDSHGYVYVVDDNDRVQKFDSLGNYITKWGSTGEDDGQFTCPSGIAIDHNGNIYVADCNNYRIQKFDNQGNFIIKWGSEGDGDGQFYYPDGIAVDKNDNIYVVESNNCRVQKFDSVGTFITKWGNEGEENGQFYWPYGIAVDRNNFVQVLDSYNNRIQVFDTLGNFIAKWGNRGSGDGQFEYPEHFAIYNNKVLVGDYSPRVQLFKNNINTNKGTCLSVLSQLGDNTFLNTINWQATQPESSSIKFRTRTSNDSLNCTNALWSDYYTASGSQITSLPGKYIQLEVTLERVPQANSPVLQSAGIEYGNMDNEIVWHKDSLISLACSAAIYDTTAIGNLASTGKFYLHGSLISQTGQDIAKSIPYEFYVSPSNFTLTLSKDKTCYRPNQTVNISGAVQNLSSLIGEGLSLKVLADSQVIYTESFDLAAGAGHTYSTSFASANPFVLKAQVIKGDTVLVELSEFVPVSAPVLDQAVLRVQNTTVGSSPFPVFLDLHNPGLVETYVNITLGGLACAETLAAGEYKTITNYFSIGRDTVITASIRGDVAQDPALPVYFGVSAWIQPVIQELYPTGAMQIPYVVYSTGTAPAGIEVRFDLYNQNHTLIQEINKSFNLSASDSAGGALNYTLADGRYTLEYQARCAGTTIVLYNGSAQFTVAGHNAAVIDTIIVHSDTCIAGGKITGFAVVRNSGANEYIGNVRLDLGFWSADNAIHLATGAIDTMEFQSGCAVPAGRYRALGQAVYGGTVIDSTVTMFDLAPRYRFVSYPGLITVDAGRRGQAVVASNNFGTAYGPGNLRLTCGQIVNEEISVYIAPGQQTVDTFTFYTEDDLEDKDYSAVFKLGNDEKDVVLHVNGIKVSVAPFFNQPAYHDGDTASFTINAINRACRSDLLNGIVTYNGQQQSKNISLGWFKEIDAVSVPGQISLQLTVADTTLPPAIWTYMYPDSGIWESAPHPVAPGASQTINWISQAPLGSAVAVYLRNSRDGNFWGEWQEQACDSNPGLPDSGFIQARIVFKTTDSLATPALSELNIGDWQLTNLDDFRCDSAGVNYRVSVQHTGQSLWAGIYTLGGRSVYLNSFIVPELRDSFNLFTDKTVYNAGDTIHARAETDLNGQLAWSVSQGVNPALSGALPIVTSPTTFDIALPEYSISGPSSIGYRFIPDMDTSRIITGQANFNIIGYGGGLLECVLDSQQYAPGSLMTVKYKLEFNQAGFYNLKGRLKDRNNNYRPAFDYTGDFPQGISTFYITDTMRLTTPGMAELLYGLYKPIAGQSPMFLSSGSSSFDVYWPDTIPPMIQSLAAAPKIFRSLSLETTSITVTLSEPCAWISIDLLNGAGDTLRRYYYQDVMPAGVMLVWNGRDKNNSTVPDGAYTVAAKCGDYGGNHSEVVSSTVYVDNQAPVISQCSPLSGAVIRDTSIISALVGDAVAGVDSAKVIVDSLFNLTLTRISGDSLSGTYQYAYNAGLLADGEHGLAFTARDQVGNISPKISYAVVVDNTAPVISISGVDSGNYYNLTVQPLITIADANLDSMIIVLNDVPYVSGTAISGDGQYSLMAWARDKAGNESNRNVSFVVDKIMPAITIEGAANNGWYNQDVTPTITIADANLDSTVIQLNGSPYASGTAVSVEGAHILSVWAHDKAGNMDSVRITFHVDKARPVISVAGISEGAWYDHSVLPVISVADANIDSSSTLLDGVPFVSGSTVTGEGHHLLTVWAIDKAGNVASDTVGFGIDTTVPVIAISGVAEGAWYNHSVTPVIAVTEAYLDSQRITLNGQPFVSGSPVDAEDEYLLTAWAKDSAENTAACQVQFGIDLGNPVITISGVADDGLYGHSVIPVIIVQESHPASSTITLNGATFVSGTTVSIEGHHTLNVVTADLAGNISTSSVQFTIDTTPPAPPVMTNPAENATVPASPIAVSGIAEAGSTVHLVAAGQSYQTTVSPAGVFQVPSVDLNMGMNFLTFVASDAAGNTSTGSVYHINYETGSGPQINAGLEVAKGARILCLAPVDCQPFDSAQDKVGHCWQDDRRFVEKALDGTGIHYAMTGDPSGFLSELRKGRYNLYIVFGDINLSLGPASGEIREKINDGHGLIVVGDHFLESFNLSDVLGVKFGGALPQRDYNLIMLQSPVSQPDTLPYTGWIRQVMPTTGQVVGTVKLAPGAKAIDHAWDITWDEPSLDGRAALQAKYAKYPPQDAWSAVVINSYGQGMTALYTFDLGDTLNNYPVYREILLRSIAYCAPETTLSGPMATIPIVVNAANTGAAGTFKTIEVVTSNVKIDTAFAGGQVGSQTITWMYNLSQNDSISLESWIRLPDQQGTYLVTAETKALITGSYQTVDTNSLTLPVDRTGLQLIDQAIAMLDSLSLSGADNAHRKNVKRELSEVRNRPVNNLSDLENGIGNFLAAVKYVNRISKDTRDIRLVIDDALAVWQARWALWQ